jgi:hypothetical protein
MDTNELRRLSSLLRLGCGPQSGMARIADQVAAAADHIDKLEQENETLRLYYKEWCKAMRVEPAPPTVR